MTRLLNQHTSADPQRCQPTWPDLPPGASLTVDPSRPPPTTAQTPFCDWPSGEQVPSYPEACRGMIVPQPRLGNPRGGQRRSVLQATVLRRQATRLRGSMPMPREGCPMHWEPCGTYQGKIRCCPSGEGTTDPSWVSPRDPHWPPKPNVTTRRARIVRRTKTGATRPRGPIGKGCRTKSCCRLKCSEHYKPGGMLHSTCMQTCIAINPGIPKGTTGPALRAPPRPGRATGRGARGKCQGVNETWCDFYGTCIPDYMICPGPSRIHAGGSRRGSARVRLLNQGQPRFADTARTIARLMERKGW